MRPVRGLQSRRYAYLLLETVVATGMLIVGLAVLGAQVQDSHTAVRKMERRIRAISLAEQHIAELEMGLVDINSVDEIVEGDFGPRFPDFGWLLTTEETAIEHMFMLRLDILHHLRDDDYSEDSFDYDKANLLETVYVMKAAPQPVNFGEDYGLNEEEMLDLAKKLDGCIPDFDYAAFDMSYFQTVDFEELIKCAPAIFDALDISLDTILAMLPPDVARQIEDIIDLDSMNDEGASEDQGEGEN